ncbi:hypothetical protein CK203_008948 [Vitis vinifera]|uniref:Uncharacterized protein n=1 Tax=Vitis vinifera TaxID=29760 RepID=A0A438K364_VITVI|nr:hypothetical protein CK203_008948 [Vitis vinifera]
MDDDGENGEVCRSTPQVKAWQKCLEALKKKVEVQQGVCLLQRGMAKVRFGHASYAFGLRCILLWVCMGVINVVFVLGLLIRACDATPSLVLTHLVILIGGQCQQTTGVLGPWEISQVNHFLGILIRALADASHEQHSLSASQVILNVVGFCATVATTIFFTVYSKRQLKALQKEEELLLE